MNLASALAAVALALSPIATVSAADSATVAPSPPKAKKICRELGQKTGSRMGNGKRCKTAEEWAKIDGENKTVTVQSSQVDTISRTN